MRIAIAYSYCTKIGGIETYLQSIVSDLHTLGHSVAFFYEVANAADRESIELPENSPAWCVAELGAQPALASLREWQPDLIYAHGLEDPNLEQRLFEIAPAVFLAHAYYGTCISGAKTFKSPDAKPCDRRFGPRCLLNYYPHRCGGLSPLTMLKEYRRQSDRCKLLSNYKAIVTLSNHMRAEYVKHGFSPEQVHCLSLLKGHSGSNGNGFHGGEPRASKQVAAFNSEALFWRLLFLGRMDFLKGGELLIDALPTICAALTRPVRITFAGDGPARKTWEHCAAQAEAMNTKLAIKFVGWVESNQRENLLNESDLLVVPSVWPEPFGLVGPEAAAHGVPAAAFAVGGISEWLTDGVNGHLAPADPPTSTGLAEAVIKCLSNPETYARLRYGATISAQRFNLKNHLTPLLRVFESIVQNGNSKTH